LEIGRKGSKMTFAYCSTCIYFMTGIKEKHLSRENLWREGLINLGGAGESFSVLPTWLIRWPRLLPGYCQAAARLLPVRYHASMHSIIKILFRALFNPRIEDRYRKGRLRTTLWTVLSTEAETIAAYTPTHK
jgi:hypothetical protein